MVYMGRTNVVIDEDLVQRVMRLYKLPSKRAAIDFALRKVAGDGSGLSMLDMRGTGWEGNLSDLRDEPIEEF